MGDFLGMGSSDKSTNASTSTAATNTDRRFAVGDSGLGISTSGSSVVKLTTDNHAVSNTVNNITATSPEAFAMSSTVAHDALASVNNAINAVSQSDVVNGQGFTQLLGLADKLFTGAGEMIDQTQKTSLAQVSALSTVVNDSKGKIDQKTIVVLAGCAAAVLIGMKK